MNQLIVSDAGTIQEPPDLIPHHSQLSGRLHDQLIRPTQAMMLVCFNPIPHAYCFNYVAIFTINADNVNFDKKESETYIFQKIGK